MRALLIIDEVMTGFRVARGGACERFGIDADLVTLGKIVGGGYPLAAFGGRREIMDKLSPSGPVYQAGTLSGNPVAAAAGLATLEVLRQPGAYERIFETGSKLMEGLSACLAKHNVEATVAGAPPMFDIVFKAGELTNYRDTLGADAAKSKAFNAGLLEHGILKGDNKFYVSLAHTDEDVAKTLDAS